MTGAEHCARVSVLGRKYSVCAFSVEISSDRELPRLLGGVPPCCVAQVFDPSLVPPLEAVVLAADYVLESFAHGKNIMDSRHYEMLLYLAGTRHFRQALQKYRARLGGVNCIIVICRECAVTEPPGARASPECLPKPSRDPESLRAVTEFYLREVV